MGHLDTHTGRRHVNTKMAGWDEATSKELWETIHKLNLADSKIGQFFLVLRKS